MLVRDSLENSWSTDLASFSQDNRNNRKRVQNDFRYVRLIFRRPKNLAVGWILVVRQSKPVGHVGIKNDHHLHVVGRPILYVGREMLLQLTRTSITLINFTDFCLDWKNQGEICSDYCKTCVRQTIRKDSSNRKF